jgi:hypothetical protein
VGARVVGCTCADVKGCLSFARIPGEGHPVLVVDHAALSIIDATVSISDVIACGYRSTLHREFARQVLHVFREAFPRVCLASCSCDSA